MDMFGLSSGSIIALAIGVIVGTVIMKIFGTAVTKTIIIKDKDGRDTISWTGILLIDIFLSGLFYYFGADLANYFRSTRFLPIAIIFVLFYVAVLIWYYKIQDKDKIRKNHRFLAFFSLLYIGIIIFFFTNELEETFSFSSNISFPIMIISFAGAFYIYYKKINKKQTKSKSVAYE